MPAEFKPGDRVLWSPDPNCLSYVFVDHHVPSAGIANIQSTDASGVFGKNSFLVFVNKLTHFDPNKLSDDEEEACFQ